MGSGAWGPRPVPQHASTPRGTDCSALLLHPTESVRRRLLAQGQPNILSTTAPPLTETTAPADYLRVVPPECLSPIDPTRFHPSTSLLFYSSLRRQTPNPRSLPLHRHTQTAAMVGFARLACQLAWRE